jgi:epoxyqueuosine reductase
MEHITELRKEVADRFEKGLIHGDLHASYLSGFRYQPPPGLPSARSMIVVAFRERQYTFVFNWEGRKIRAVVPPTYILHGDTEREIRSRIAGILASEGYNLASTRDSPIPLKTLAVRSGLAAYGRNNICYIPGFGSYLRLVGFFTDLPCPHDQWRPPSMMEICRSCSRCLNACPTGAIDRDRFLLHGERCLTYLNENTAPLPDWLKASWHNCLIGCLLCQRVCPGNGRVKSKALAEFSEEETRAILDGMPLGRMPPELAAKMRETGLAGLMDVIPRNLRVLLERV